MRKHGKKNKEDKETVETPGWLEGENNRDNVQTRSKNKSRELQQHRNTTRNHSTGRRVRRPKRDTRQDSQRSQSRARDSQRGTERVLVGGAGAERLSEISFTFTLRDIKNSISDRTLHDLANGTFDPMQTVKITKSNIQVSSLAEDALLGPTKIARGPRTRTSKKKLSKPSERFIKDVSSYENQGPVTARVILGYYFTLYKQLYREEDPDFSGASAQSAIILVDKMVNEVTDGDYKKVINFVRRIMPLWYRRLKQGDGFPRTRPTIASLFGDKRHFWANRKIYFKQWQNR